MGATLRGLAPMFIEIAELLRCPEPHEDAFCVVGTGEMRGRMIMRGIIGCPSCQREYPILQGVARFGELPADPHPSQRLPDPDPEVVWPLLALTGPGGYVVLLGTAARLARSLAQRIEGVHFVGVNAPQDVPVAPELSLLTHPARIPLRSSVARGVVLGPDALAEGWVSEAARVLLPGLRLVAMTETLSHPGVDRLAVGRGHWVGAKGATVGRAAVQPRPERR